MSGRNRLDEITHRIREVVLLIMKSYEANPEEAKKLMHSILITIDLPRVVDEQTEVKK